MSFKYFNVKNGLTTGNITLHSSNANIQANYFLGNINVTSSANLGAVGNVKITGGENTYVLSTDGTGNLSWVAPSGGQGGTPGGSNTQVQFNDAGSFAGNSGFTFNKVTGVFSALNLSVTGNANAGNLSTSGLVVATGNIQSNASLVTDDIAGRTTSVTITAAGTNQNINLVPTGTGKVNVGNFIISNVQTPVADSDAATKKYVDDVAQGLNIHDSCQAATPNTLAIVTGGTITYNNGANGVGANLTTTGSFNLIDGVNVQTAGTRILVKNEANAVFNGIYTWSNATVITRAIDYDTVPEVEAGDFVFVSAGTLYDNTGWVQTSSPAAIGTAGNVIEFTQFSGAGTYTAGTGLTLTGSQFSISNTTVASGSYGNGDFNATFTVNQQGQLTAAANVALTPNAANLSGTTLKSTIVNSSLTSVGTLTTLSVSGNANVGNLGTAGAVTATGNGTFGNIISGGSVTTTGAGGNITGANVVFANSFSATGNITGGNLSVSGVSNLGPVGNVRITGGTANFVLSTDGTGNLSWVAQSGGGGGGSNISNGTSNVNIPSANGNINLTAAGNTVIVVTGTGANINGTLSVTGNANVGNLGTAGLIVATGNVTGGNLTTAGALSVTGNANVGNIGAAAGVFTTVAGSLTTASQPNVTSVGTLTSVAVTGNATAGNVYANSGTIGASLLTGTLTTAAQPNITSVGTLTALTVTGNITAGNINAGNLLTANFIAGTLTTAAQGNITSLGTLSSLTATGNITGGNLIGILANGNSNVRIPSTNGNVTISSAGNANIVVITGTGANITGTANVTGNLSVGGKSNLGPVSNVIITGGTANYVLSTDGVGNLSWVAQSGGGGGGSVLVTSDTFTGNGVQTQFTLSVTPANINYTTVNYNGVTLLNTDYSVSGNVLTISSPPANNSSIQVNTISGGGGGSANIAIYDEGNLLTSTVSSLDFVGSGVTATNVGNAVTVTITGGGGGGGPAAITLDSFTGNGVQTTFTLSTTPQSENNTFVNIDGVSQLKTDYSLSGANIIFDGAPANGAKIEVTIVSALSNAQPSFTTRNYTGNGVQSTFTVTNGVTSTGVLVTENGILQTPDSDYTVSGANLTFTSAPANAQAIQIRELGTVVAASANSVTAARALGYSLIFGG